MNETEAYLQDALDKEALRLSKLSVEDLKLLANSPSNTLSDGISQYALFYISDYVANSPHSFVLLKQRHFLGPFYRRKYIVGFAFDDGGELAHINEDLLNSFN